jgi:muconolactone delta-isomerase
MLFLSKIRLDQQDLSLKSFWDVWADGAGTAESSTGDGGPVAAIYKVVGQRRVITINQVADNDELDRIMMGAPLAQYMTVEEMIPLREYAPFAADLRVGWQVPPYIPDTERS